MTKQYTDETGDAFGLPDRPSSRSGDDAGFSLLRDKLKSANSFDCRAAAEALGQLGPAAAAAVPDLLAAARGDQAHVRRAAAEALGKVGDAAAVLELLQSRDSYVRKLAVEALGGAAAPAPDLVPALHRLLEEDLDLGVHLAVAEALGRVLRRPPGELVPGHLHRDRDLARPNPNLERIAQFFADLPADAENRFLELPRLTEGFHLHLAAEVAGHLNRRLAGQAPHTPEAKRRLADWVNDLLARLGLAVRCPATGQTAYLKVSVDSHHPGGRFCVFPRGSSKPSLTRTALADLLPLTLTGLSPGSDGTGG